VVRVDEFGEAKDFVCIYLGGFSFFGWGVRFFWDVIEGGLEVLWG